MNQPSYDFSTPEDIIAKALLYLEDRLRYQPSTALNGSQNIFDYARLQLAREKEEVFAVFFLCDDYRLLAFEKLLCIPIGTNACSSMKSNTGSGVNRTAIPELRER